MSLIAAPAFGKADLSNCERELIHLAGSIQPHGALLVVREPELEIIQASVNAASFLELDAEPLGRRIADILPGLRPSLAPDRTSGIETIPKGFRQQLGKRAFDIVVHRLSPGPGMPSCLVVELERAAAPANLSEGLARGFAAIADAASIEALAHEGARIFKGLTGYDRVMLYRFDDQGHGEVFAEEREPQLEALLGNRYPASDIPQIARRLYMHNRVRVLVDVDYQSIPIRPARSPITGGELDMSLSTLRSMSPIHIQYLKNMGVAATLVASLVVGGRLWGLVACHHYRPRALGHAHRVACELLAEAVATRIAGLESFVQAQTELAVRRLEQRMIESISRDGDWRSALFDGNGLLLQPLRASGAALLLEDQVLTAGEVPGTPQLRAIGAWLDTRERSDALFATASFGLDEPRFAALIPIASGLLATPVSTEPGEYLIWFRREQVRWETWGGNPNEPAVSGADPAQLSPRLSFAKWRQRVQGTSETWTPAERTTARLIGRSLADVVLQFRAVRMLIARSQLQQVTSQVTVSDQPVLVTDAAGEVLVANDALIELLPATEPVPQRLDEIRALIDDGSELSERVDALLETGRSWRAEVTLRTRAGLRPMMLRADPVFSSPGRILGCVVLLVDLTEQREVEQARRRLQEKILEQSRRDRQRLDRRGDIPQRTLLGSIVGNAQLTALEITDGVDFGRMPQMLESVRDSVSRTAQLLEQLNGGDAASDGPPEAAD